MKYLFRERIHTRYGDIYRVKRLNSNENFAAIVNSKEYAKREDVAPILNNEIKILQELKNEHENIIKFIETLNDDLYYYFIFEWCNGKSLSFCLDRYKSIYKKPFSEEIVQYLMRQIVNGLKYIHQKDIIHRDIKLTNILVKFYSIEDYNNVNMLKSKIKINDFKIAKKAIITNSAKGTAAYADPRIALNIAENKPQVEEGYDKSIDIWSLGTVCYELLIGQRLFQDKNMKDLIQKLEIGNYSIPTSFSHEIVSFLNGMLQYDSKKRLTIEELSEHDFLKKDVKDFSKIDLDLICSKIVKSKINLNIKNNKSVWDIFNDEQKLSALHRILHLTPDDDEQEINNIPETDTNFNNISKLNKNNINNNNNNQDNYNVSNNNNNNNDNNNNNNNKNNNNNNNYHRSNSNNISINNNYNVINNNNDKNNNINNYIRSNSNNIPFNNIYNPPNNMEINNYKKAFSGEINNNNNMQFEPMNNKNINLNNNISNNYQENRNEFYRGNLSASTPLPSSRDSQSSTSFKPSYPPLYW